MMVIKRMYGVEKVSHLALGLGVSGALLVSVGFEVVLMLSTFVQLLGFSRDLAIPFALDE